MEKKRILAAVNDDEIAFVSSALSGKYEVERIDPFDQLESRAVLVVVSAAAFEEVGLICERLRGQLDLPVIIISRSDSVADMLSGLSVGDDCVPPCCPESEFLARVDAKLRSTRSLDGIVTFGRISLDAVTCEAFIGDEVIQLTRREFAILFCLAERRDSVVPRELLISEAGLPTTDSNILWLTISRLKQKLSTSRTRISVAAVRGLGYRL